MADINLKKALATLRRFIVDGGGNASDLADACEVVLLRFTLVDQLKNTWRAQADAIDYESYGGECEARLAACLRECADDLAKRLFDENDVPKYKKATCRSCNGSGKLFNGEPNHEGYIDPTQCPRCKGTGEVPVLVNMKEG